MNPTEVTEWLEWFKKQRPVAIFKTIKEGDYILKGSEYEIYVDDVKKVIETFSYSGGINLQKIREYFTSREHHNTFGRWFKENCFAHGGSKCIKLSDLIKDRMGECTEMSIIVQILSQALERETYWITGFISEKEDPQLILHAFNIGFKSGESYIVDAAAMQSVKIIDIVNNDGEIEIIVEDKSPIQYFLN